MRYLAVLLLLTATAGAYPFAVPEQTGAAAAFRKRNPQHWLVVETDKRGLIMHVATDDPSLVGKKGHDRIVAIRALLHGSADLFGFTPATADRLPDSGLLMDEAGSALLGEIHVQGGAKRIDITTMFWVDAKPKIDPEDVAKRLVGQSYEETIGYAMPPARDCMMSGLGKRGCIMPVRERRKREVTFARRNVEIFSALLREGDTIRLVACADVRLFEDPPITGMWASERSFVPTAGGPKLPLVVDRVTGDVIDAHVKSCYDPKLMDPRQRD